MSAIPLVIFNADGTCEVHDEAMAVLEKIHKPVAVVAVAGRYRTGKSFLLNHVLLRAPPGGGFQVGPTTQPCTKGLWLWTDPVHDSDDRCTLVIDTEGTGATNSDDNRDTRIFALALLLSSYFVYNSQGSIDEPALSNLQVVTNVSKMVRVSAEDTSPFAGAFGEEPKPCTEIGEVFPRFLWVVRDFILELRAADGREIGEDEYLEEALKDHKGDNDKAGLRAALKNAFPHRDCCTLVRPVSDETHLRHLDSMPESEMRPEFVKQTHRLRRKVLEGAPAKTLQGQAVTGPVLAGLCRCYAESINTGAAPVIENAWAMVCADQCRRAVEQGTAAWSRVVDAAPRPVGPWTAFDTLQNANRQAEEACSKRAVGEHKGEALEQLRAACRERCEGRQREWHEQWRGTFADHATKLLAGASFEGLPLQQVFEKLQGLFAAPPDAMLPAPAAAAGAPGWAVRCCREQVAESLAAAALPQLGGCIQGVCAEWEHQLRAAQEERMAALQEQLEARRQLQQLREAHEAEKAELRASVEQHRARVQSSEARLKEQVDHHSSQLDRMQEEHLSERAAATSDIEKDVQRIRDDMAAEMQTHHSKLEALQSELQQSRARASALEQQVQELTEEVEHQRSLTQELRQGAQRASVAETRAQDLERQLSDKTAQLQAVREDATVAERRAREQLQELTAAWEQRSTQAEATRKEQDTQIRQQLEAAEADLARERKALHESEAALARSRENEQAEKQKHHDQVHRYQDELTQKAQELLEMQKCMEARLQTARGKTQEEIGRLQQEKRQADEACLRKEMAMHRESHELKAKGEVLEVKMREANHRLHDMQESLSKKRSRCDELEQSMVELESLRHQVKWLGHQHNEDQRALAQLSKERDSLERELQQSLQKATHKVSTLELKYSTKEEQVQGLKLQCETLRRQESALRKENEGLKKLVNRV